MTQFSIVVTIKVKPGEAGKFRGIILENAAASLRDEADYHKFDVLNYEEDPETFIFYGVYTNAAALDSHRETPHLKKICRAFGRSDRRARRQTVPTNFLNAA